MNRFDKQVRLTLVTGQETGAQNKILLVWAGDTRLGLRTYFYPTFASFELRSEGEESLVLDIEFLVQLGQDEYLRSPVLGVGGTILQPQQGEPCSGESQSSYSITPLLLSSVMGLILEIVFLSISELCFSVVWDNGIVSRQRDIESDSLNWKPLCWRNNSPLKLNVLVDDQRDSNSNQRKVPARHEHDGDAENSSEDRQ